MRLVIGRAQDLRIRQNVAAPMESEPRVPGPYTFGPYEFDPVAFRLSRGGESIAVEPKALDVLKVLLDRAPAMVSKAEIFDLVWTDVAVTDNALTRVVAQLRKALDDDAKNPSYIETVATRGYRMATAVARGSAPTLPSAVVSAASEPLTAGERAAASIPEVPAAPQAPSPARSPHRWTWAALAIAVVTLGVLGWALSRPTVQQAAPVAAPPALLSLESRNVSNPSLSPDGGSVAYASDRTGSFEIYVSGLARGSRELALTRDGGQNGFPSWSPDGKWVAYHSRSRGGIWIVPATGGSPAQVASRGMSPSWSPDSEWVVYTTSEGGTAAQSTLEIVRRDGSGRRSITAQAAPAGGHMSPVWSRSGRVITFIVNNGLEFTEIWATTRDGARPWKLTNEASVGAFALGPGDRSIYYTAGQVGARALYRVDTDPESLAVQGPPTLIPGVPPALSTGISISPGGMLAIGVIPAVERNLWAIDRRGDGTWTEPQQVTRDRLRASLPAVSPDGNRVAYSQSGPGVEGSVWVAGIDGSNRTPLFLEGTSSDPSWAAGGRVFVARGGRTEQQTFWLVDLQSKRGEPVTALPTENVRSPRLSPDGRTLAFWRLEADGSMNTYTQQLDSRESRRITSDGEAMYYPTWSPDSRWLAVEIKRGQRTQVGIVPAQGGAVVQLTNAPGQNWPHSWSPDGHEIVFAGERDGVWNLFTVSRVTGAIQQLTHLSSSSGYVRYPAWSPKGDRIVFERGVYDGAIWTMNVQ